MTTSLLAQEAGIAPQLDRSKPVPQKAEIIAAWQKRQDAIKTFRFTWSETQTHAKGWLPNPRYPERERLAIPALLSDRTYKVTKSLQVDGSRMRYTFELDRPEDPQLGVGRHYSHASDSGETRVTSMTSTPPPTFVRKSDDAQNLDVRPILLAFRPLDPVMGHLLIERAVTNQMRTFYKGKSIFLLEERHDPSGWKTVLWLEPERDFIVRRFSVLFEQNWIVDTEIEYTRDAKWGWIPSAWRTMEMLADGTKRVLSTAKVESYRINE